MKKKLIIAATSVGLFAVIYALVAVTRPDLLNSSAPSPHTMKLWGEVREGVTDRLVDPLSAVFSCVSFDKQPSEDGGFSYAFRGAINAKNRFGGYTGKVYFSWFGKDQDLVLGQKRRVYFSDKELPNMNCPDSEHFN